VKKHIVTLSLATALLSANAAKLEQAPPATPKVNHLSFSLCSSLMVTFMNPYRAGAPLPRPEMLDYQDFLRSKVTDNRMNVLIPLLGEILNDFAQTLSLYLKTSPKIDTAVQDTFRMEMSCVSQVESALRAGKALYEKPSFLLR
jgi:hypothetical protein